MYHVLICDDQPDIVNALKIYLKPEGYRLYEAANGQQAVDVLERSGISPQARAEELPLELLLHLSDIINSYIVEKL